MEILRWFAKNKWLVILLFLVDENGKKETVLQSEYSDRILNDGRTTLGARNT